MRTFLPLLSLLIPGLAMGISSSAQIPTKDSLLTFHKIIIRKGNDLGKKISLLKDSAVHIQIDTLIMENGASISIYGKKAVKLTINHASIGSKCKILTSDSRNNGSDLSMYICFSTLGSLYIDASGKNFRDGIRRFPIGNGGNVSVSYLGSCLVPQRDKNKPHYLAILNEGGKGSLNPNADLSVVHAQLSSGRNVPGRPLSGLPQGTVYQGSDGKNGTVKITAIQHF